jgi:hypothetical protein
MQNHTQDRLYCRKHNGILQCYFAHVSQRCGEAKSVIDAGVFFSALQYVVSIKVCDGLIMTAAHACKTTT